MGGGGGSCALYLVTQLCPTLCNPIDCSPPGSSVHGILQARILEWIAMASPRGSSRPRDRTQVSHTAGGFLDSLLSKLPGKPKNTGVGSLALLQGSFLTQGATRALLQCRWILYQLSYPGSPVEGQSVKWLKDRYERLGVWTHGDNE